MDTIQDGVERIEIGSLLAGKFTSVEKQVIGDFIHVITMLSLGRVVC